MTNPSSARRIALAALAAALPLVGCEDPFGGSEPLPTVPTTVSLSDFRTGPLGEPVAFQLSERRPVRPSRTIDWDFVYWVTDAGEPQFRPRNMIVAGSSDAGLAPVEVSFEQLGEAPADGYVTDEPVAAGPGAVYAVRSRQDASLGLSCRRYGKIEVTSVNAEAGTVTFRHLVNPNCEQRSLTPGGEGEE